MKTSDVENFTDFFKTVASDGDAAVDGGGLTGRLVRRSFNEDGSSRERRLFKLKIVAAGAAWGDRADAV